MIYKIVLSPKAEIEIDDAIQYYNHFSKSAAKSFKKQLSNSYKKIRLNPFFEKKYNNVRFLPFSKYPYIVLFWIDEVAKKAFVLSVFCTHQNPENYP
ncbi:type II toxin-antitoxin system RelE/ParE family toxin [Chryseobacterium wangxinyae]|uniref:type II toxin-antitoxin system RelE/ParE family toxin n=1 Tax=unclassified Chryseobacterium TaxID=2593645 RepID=UPI00226F9D6F|nr:MULTISPECIES: type II toxin-antitoxin system RelE/ParE family toxin [unclassified Chryseobacterium]MCY0969770.1 type II toxin-antitoxin system RelE/ParE family toxin [Chryseobacterium sp. CY353]MCY0976240.1 type II toxin-antitoxin system RelE/ParE family toxin [Chryseobacterium sp. CY350]WBZ94162.1 type II toxin-antitoxin system RelE/ParE family toxin [Chryseobacterium sp. CY350]